MQFSNFSRLEEGLIITLYNKYPIENVGAIKYYSDNASGVFARKDFRWSFNNEHWSSWSPLTQSNISYVNTFSNYYFFIQIRYTLSALGSGTVTNFVLNYTLGSATPATPRILTEDIESADASAILIHDILQSYETISIVDAQTLNGYPGSWYLNRANHTGYQPIGTITGLQSILNNLQSAAGVSYAYVDGSFASRDLSINYIINNYLPNASLGYTFYWDSSGYLEASGTGAGNYDTSLDPSLAVPTTIGGITAGTTVYQLYGLTYTQLFDDLLFPTINPTFVAPSATFADNIASLIEIGSAISGTFTTTFSRGSISIGATFQNYRSGLPVSYYFSDPSNNTLLIDVSSASLTNIQSISGYVVKKGIQYFYNDSVVYGAGPQPLDSKGNVYGSPLAAGSTGSLNTNFEGVYPLYATTVSISTQTKQSLVSMISGNSIQLNIVPESGGYKGSFEIPTTWITSRPLVGIETYNTVSSQWAYEGGSAAASLTFWNLTSDTQNIQGNLINYNKYTYNGTDRSSVSIMLQF